MAKTLLLGLGNDLRGDDGIAFFVIDEIKGILSKYKKNGVSNCIDCIDIENTISSGINILSYFIKYEKIIIIDSVLINSEENQSRKFWQLTDNDIINLPNFKMRTSHGIGLSNVLKIVKTLYDNKTNFIQLFLIEIDERQNNYINTVSDEISDSVKALIPLVSKVVIEHILKGENNG